MSEDNLQWNITPDRFELEVNGSTAFIEYEIHDNALTLIQTQVPLPLRSQGIASVIIEKVLQYAKEKGYRIIPVCAYVQAYLKWHHEWQYLLAS